MWSTPRSGDGGPKSVELERILDHVGNGHRKDAGQPADVGSLEAASRPSQAEAGQHVGPCRAAQVGRRRARELGEQPASAPDPAVQVEHGVGVAPGSMPEAVGGARGIAPEGDPLAVRVRHERRDVGRDKPQSVLAQPQLARHRRSQAAHRVGERRHAGTGHDLAGVGRTAEPLACFQDQRRQSGAGEQAPGNQAVVAAADDDRVPAVTRRAARAGAS